MACDQQAGLQAPDTLKAHPKPCDCYDCRYYGRYERYLRRRMIEALIVAALMLLAAGYTIGAATR